MRDLAADRVTLGVLENHGGGFGAVDLDLDHGAGGGQRGAQLTLIDVETDGIFSTAVEHAGHAASRRRRRAAREPSAGRETASSFAFSEAIRAE